MAPHGPAVAAIEKGFQKAEIERTAYRVAQEVESGDRTVVGVNRFVTPDDEHYEPLRVDPAIEAGQAARLAALRSSRDATAVAQRLAELRAAAAGTGNVLPPMREALRTRATLGEICDTLRVEWGVHRPVERF